MKDETSSGSPKSTVSPKSTPKSTKSAGKPAGKPAAVPTAKAFEGEGTDVSAGLTERQRKVLEVIRASVTERGYPPSIREIGDAVGLTSTSSVAHQLRTLERKGFLRRDPNRPRAVDVRGLDEVQADHAAAVADGSAPPPRNSSPHPRSFRFWGVSPRAGRFWPSKLWRMCSRCRANSWARAHCSCSRSSVSR